MRDGDALQAQFCWPRGLCIDDDGTLRVADCSNHAIRRVSSTGLITLRMIQKRVFSFLLGTHHRLGSHSCIALLNPDMLGIIVDFVFGRN